LIRAILLLLKYKVVDRIVSAENLAGLVFAAIIPEIDNQIQMQATLLTETCDFVFRRGVGVSAGYRQLALLWFGQEAVSTIPAGYGGSSLRVWIIVWRGGREEVAASSIFVAGIIGEEVL
jgi:hypothetical protein